MDHHLPELPNAAIRTKPAHHEPAKSPIPVQEIFADLSLLLTVEEILQLHRHLRHKSEEDVRSLAEQCHRRCEPSLLLKLYMLICASCRTFGFSTIIAIFPDHKILAHVLGLERVHALSRIDLAATATEQYICRRVILCAGVRRFKP